MINLHELNQENRKEALDLKISEDRKFVASNLYSIAQYQFHHGMKNYSIFFYDKMSDFAIFGVDETFHVNRFSSRRLMITKDFRNKSFRKMAMKEIINIVK